MRTSNATWLLAVVLGAAAVACGDDPDAIRGSGDIEVETRTVDGFDGIRLEGSGDVVVDIGGTESLSVETDDNLLPYIRTEVEGSTLVLETDVSIAPTRGISYSVGAIRLDDVSVVGSGDVVAPNLDCEDLAIAVTGSGRFDVGGSCESLELQITGSGDFDGADLAVRVADISIAGNGDAVVHATDELRVSISGAGDVTYLGDPVTDIDIQGSGDVRKGA